MFTVSKEASTESCEFHQLSTTVSLPRLRERMWEMLPSASVSRWRVLFFAEKTSLLRVYPGRCVEKSSKVSLHGCSSLKLFNSTLTSRSTEASRRWCGSKCSCQSCTLQGPGVGGGGVGGVGFTATDGLRDQYITFLSPRSLLHQRISTEKFYKSNIHEPFQLDLSWCSSASAFAFLWNHNGKQTEFFFGILSSPCN